MPEPARAHDAGFARRLILATQAGLPLTATPYATLAAQLGTDEASVIEALRSMLDDGSIRRIAAVPNHYRLGYTVNAMSVWDVDDAVVDALGERVAALDFVSHCYQRPRALPLWPYNLFAMVHARSEDEAAHKIAAITRTLEPHCRASDTLVSTRILKKTGLRLSPGAPSSEAS